MPRHPAAEPWSGKACDVLVLALALWTVACNATVLFGGGLDDLLWLAALLVPAGLALAAFAARRGRSGVAPSPAPEADAEGPERTSWTTTAVALGLSAAIAAGLVGTRHIHLVWWASVAYLTWAAWQVFREERGEGRAAVPSRWKEACVWLLAAGCALVPLYAHKASTDDAFYVNLAVGAADDPAAPLLRYDTLHGIEGLPILQTVYKVHSFELLGAALARLTPLSAIQALHFVLAALFGAFLAPAYAKLFRRIAPATWFPALLAVLVVLLAVAETPQFYTNFGLFRMQQGKAAFLSVLVPLVIAYAVAYARRPSARGWGMLSAAQIAAVGLSSTALWAAPILAGLGLLAGRPRRAGLRATALGVGASAYVVAAGLVLYGRSLRESATDRLISDGVQLVSIRTDPIRDGGELIAETWRVVLGDGALAWVAAFALLGAWSVGRTAAARRLGVVYPLAFVLCLWNPYLAMQAAKRLTGGATYWRVLWIVPLPALLALLFTAPLRLRSAGLAVYAALLIGFAAFVPRTHGFSESNGVRRAWLSPKVLVEPYHVAGSIRDLVPPRSAVLVPWHVSTWVPTFHDHPYPLVVNDRFLVQFVPYLGREEADRRIRLYQLVSGLPQLDGAALLRDGIRRYDLRSVTFVRRTGNAPVIRGVLESSGFRRAMATSKYETWVLAPGSTPR